jgi:hypothetical protein
MRPLSYIRCLTEFTCIDILVKWVPCQHGMARPQVADGGEGLQIWMVAANILNKQSRTADKGWPSSLGVGRGANNSPQYKNKPVTKCYKGKWSVLFAQYCYGDQSKEDEMGGACGAHGGGEGCIQHYGWEA